jgi:hypothetical protein
MKLRLAHDPGWRLLWFDPYASRTHAHTAASVAIRATAAELSDVAELGCFLCWIYIAVLNFWFDNRVKGLVFTILRGARSNIRAETARPLTQRS